jgi:hypothetical protein
MSSTTDLDRLIATWLGDGPTAAPDGVVDLAVASTERVRQRRAWDSGLHLGSVHFAFDPLGLAVIAIALVVMTTAIGIGTGVISLPPPDRDVDTSPMTSTEPTPELSDELRLFTNVEGGYELLLPASWANAPEDLDFGDGQIATAFGRGRGAGTRTDPGLTIIVGGSDGSITPCSSCDRVTVTSLSDLEEAVVSTPRFFTSGPAERHADVMLGGEPARSERAGIANNCLGCPDAYYHVYAIRDGRPYVLAFDYWTVRFGSLALPDGSEQPFQPSTLEAILDSFVFVDREPADSDSADGARFAAPDGTFEITLPEAWEQVEGPDPAALYLRGAPNLALSIRAGDADGQIDLCDSPAGAWESCPTVRASTLDELSSAIRLDGTRAAVWVGPIPYESELDGEPAVTSYLTGGIAPPTTVKYVVAMRAGRPFVIRAVQQRSPDNIGDLAALLQGFRFVDAASPSRDPDGTYAYPAAGFSYLPSGRLWRKVSGRNPTHLALSGSNMDIYITSGDENGRLRTCDEPAWRDEECGFISAHDLETLTDALHLSGSRSNSSTVAGEPANVIVAAEDASTAGLVARFAIQVAVVHDGRPFLIRISGRGEQPAIGRLLEGFQFLDAPTEP